MHYFVETENIARFTALLRKETRPKERAVLAELLVEEEAKLAAKIAGECAPISSEEPSPDRASAAQGPQPRAG